MNCVDIFFLFNEQLGSGVTCGKGGDASWNDDDGLLVCVSRDAHSAASQLRELAGSPPNGRPIGWAAALRPKRSLVAMATSTNRELGGKRGDWYSALIQKGGKACDGGVSTDRQLALLLCIREILPPRTVAPLSAPVRLRSNVNRVG